MPEMIAARAAPGTAEERRDQSLSFGDQESLVYQALLAYLGDGAADDCGCVDIWICDLATDWVVWRSWSTHGPGPGLWQVSYTVDDSGAATLSGDPLAVVEQTSYVPAEAKSTVAAAPSQRTSPRGAGGDLETRKAARAGMRNVREVRRCPLDFELRDVANGTGGSDLVFTGYASVTCPADSDDAAYEMEDWVGPWTESVTTGAFRKTLSEKPDVVFLVNHEGMTLARTKPGTLKLSETTVGDPTGLHSEARLDPKSPHVKALRSAVERGDVDEMSFAFRVTRQEWDEDYTRRWINEVSLHQGDVSAVNYGANPHTGGTTSIRKRGEARLDLRAYMSALAELREGKTISQATRDSLSQIFDLVPSGDGLDEARSLLSQLMGTTEAPADESAENALSSARLLALPDYGPSARAKLAAALRAA